MRGNIKKGIFAALVIGVAMIASSCARIQLNGEIKEDGTSSLGLTYGLSTDYFSEDDFAEESKKYEIKRFTIDGKEYVGYSYTENLKSTEEFDRALITTSERGSVLFKEAKTTIKHGLFTNKYIFEGKTVVLMDDTTDLSGSSMKASDLIAVDFTLVMPGKITEHTGGELLPDGKTILFRFDPQSEEGIRCVSESIAFTQIAIMLTIVTAGVIALILVLSKKKAEKERSDAIAMSSGANYVIDDADKFFNDKK